MVLRKTVDSMRIKGAQSERSRYTAKKKAAPESKGGLPTTTR
jgi:hypothetical protein